MDFLAKSVFSLATGAPHGVKAQTSQGKNQSQKDHLQITIISTIKKELPFLSAHCAGVIKR